jgi:hypothetical protein
VVEGTRNHTPTTSIRKTETIKTETTTTSHDWSRKAMRGLDIDPSKVAPLVTAAPTTTVEKPKKHTEGDIKDNNPCWKQQTNRWQKAKFTMNNVVVRNKSNTQESNQYMMQHLYLWSRSKPETPNRGKEYYLYFKKFPNFDKFHLWYHASARFYRCNKELIPQGLVNLKVAFFSPKYANKDFLFVFL